MPVIRKPIDMDDLCKHDMARATCALCAPRGITDPEVIAGFAEFEKVMTFNSNKAMKMIARYDTVCIECGEHIAVGDMIAKMPRNLDEDDSHVYFVHEECL